MRLDAGRGAGQHPGLTREAPLETRAAPPALSTAAPGAWASGETADLARLALVTLTVLATWVLLGWWPGWLLSGQDGVAMWMPLLVRQDATGGVWDWAWLGGAKITPVYGDAWPMALARGLGLDPVGQLNAGVLVLQVCTGFLAVRLVAALDVHNHVDIRVVPLTWLSAFTPVFGARLGEGHVNLLMAGAGVATVPVLLAVVRAGRSSLVTWAVALGTLVMALQTCGQQVLVYGAVFGLPLVLQGLWLERSPAQGPLPALAWTGVAAVAAVALSLPALGPMLEHVRSSDAGRTLSDQGLLTSMAAWSVQDALSSALLHPLQTEPGASLHERHAAWGPFLVLALVSLRHRKAGVAWVLGSVVVGAGFALGQEPVSGILLRLVPPLGAFRVPSRVMLAVIPVLGMLAVAVVRRWPPGNRTLGVALAGALVLPLLLPPSLQEAAAWLALGVLAHQAWQARGSAALAVAACVLASSNLGAFRERLHPFVPADAVLAGPQDAGRKLKEQNPGLQAPLARVSMPDAMRRLGPNVAALYGLGAVEGYGHPPRRMEQLWAALDGVPLDPGRVLFIPVPGSAASRVLSRLYNVQWSQSSGLQPVPGSAWLASSVLAVPGWTELAAALTAQEVLPDPALVVAEDPATHPARALPPLDCTGLPAPIVNTVDGPALEVQLGGTARAPCVLVVSTTFLEVVEAQDGQGRALATFPVLGALLGVALEAGTREVLLRAKPPRAAWNAAAGVGVLLALTPLLGLWSRRRRPAVATEG